jgi:hypothetical protein
MMRCGVAWAAGLCAASILGLPAPASAAAPAAAPPGGPSGAPIAPAIPSLEFRRLSVRSDGAVTVHLACTAGSGGCRGIGTLSADRRHARPMLLGANTTRIAAGGTRTLLIGLSGSGRALLARRGTLTASLEVAQSQARVRTVVAVRRFLIKAPGPTGAQVVDYAKRFIGRPYVWGANGPGTFDCSGFTSYVYARFGHRLARVAAQQMRQGAAVTGPLAAGDLIFWNGGGHVGIYTGHGNFISATVHRGIWIYSLQDWRQWQSYATARRILG